MPQYDIFWWEILLTSLIFPGNILTFCEKLKFSEKWIVFLKMGCLSHSVINGIAQNFLHCLFIFLPAYGAWVSLVAQTVQNLPTMRETWVWSLDWEDLLEEGMATHSSILAWRVPIDRGAWWATVHGGHKELDMTEHRTALKNLRTGSEPSQFCFLNTVLYRVHRDCCSLLTHLQK